MQEIPVLNMWSVPFVPPSPVHPIFRSDLPAEGVTWWGCGAHIPSVMDAVPAEQWCSCAKPPGSVYPPMASYPAAWCTIF